MTERTRRRWTLGWRFAGALRRDDRGIALPMVLLVFVLGIALVSAFLVAIVGSSQVTATTKSSLQAQAAAEAGIAAAVAKMQGADPCTAVPSPLTGGDPSYSVTTTCNAAKTQVVVLSSGTAPGGAQQRVQTVYSLTPPALTPTTGGPALFYSSRLGSRLNGYVFDEARSEVKPDAFSGSGSVYASTGDFACGDGSVLPQDVLVSSGNFQIDSGCVIRGNAYVGGILNLNRGSVEGNIVAPKNDVHNVTGRVGKPGSNGNVTVGGTITLNDGYVEGDVVAAGSGNSTLGSGKIKGSFRYRGTYSSWGTPASGIVARDVVPDATLVPPVLPVIPAWKDVEFGPAQQAAWTAAGFQIVTVPSAECRSWQGTHNQNPIWPRLSEITNSTVFDVRACEKISTNEGLNPEQRKIQLKADIAIIARQGVLTGMTFSSDASRTMWFITPDAEPSKAGPQCPSADSAGFTVRGNAVGDKVALYLYTPCVANFNASGQWRGQVYSGDLIFGGGVSMAFAPRSIPGYDFSGGGGGGGTPGSSGPSTLGSLVSQRNVT